MRYELAKRVVLVAVEVTIYVSMNEQVGSMSRLTNDNTQRDPADTNDPTRCPAVRR